MKKTLTAITLAVLSTLTIAGPASALNKAGGGGSCVRWEYYTNARGWPDYRCVSYYYGR